MSKTLSFWLSAPHLELSLDISSTTPGRRCWTWRWGLGQSCQKGCLSPALVQGSSFSLQKVSPKQILCVYFNPCKQLYAIETVTWFIFFLSWCQIRKRVKLEGKELEEYLEKDKIKKEAAKKLEQAKEWVTVLVRACLQCYPLHTLTSGSKIVLSRTFSCLCVGAG